MEQLKKEEFCKIEENIELQGLNPEAISVIMKNNPGNIYVDNIQLPKTAIVWSFGMEGFYFIGENNSPDINNRIKMFVENQLIKEMLQKDYDCFEVSGSSPDWDVAIKEIFNHKKLDSWLQLVYEGDINTEGKTIKTDSSYEIRSIKDQNFDMDQLQNKDYLRDEVLLFWDNIESIRKMGNCYYAIVDNEVAGFCYTSFVANNKKVIGIETAEKYRRNKIAYNLASKCLHEISGEGMIPYWDCMDENIASKQLALKIGLEKSGEYTCFGFAI